MVDSSTGVPGTSTGTDTGVTDTTESSGTTEGETDSTTSGTTDDTGTTGTTGTGSTTDPSTDSGTTEGMSASDSEDSVGFIVEPTEGMPDECDLWAQDCPEGEKCMPYGEGGSPSWNAAGCFPVDPSPAAPGDACTVEGSGTSGLDTCDVGVMCWDVDTETNMGTCTAMCTNTPDNPICTDPDTTCVIANSGYIILCLPVCDPLLQDCPDAQGCYPINDSFVCAPDASGDDMGAPGDPCEFINTCDMGNACIDDDAYGNCFAAGCCSPFCPLDEPALCPEITHECVPWYEEGTAPVGFENVGVCSQPV